MSEHMDRAIAELEDRLKAELEAAAPHLRAATKFKIAINQLAEVDGKPTPYPDVDAHQTAGAPAAKPAAKGVQVRSDEFYGRALSTCVREVLQMRKTAGLGPASIEDIYAVMKDGGYAFESKDVENAMRGLGVSITKNSALFARLPSGLIGLVEWYGKAPRRRQKADDSGADIDADVGDAGVDDGDQLRENGDSEGGTK